MVELRLAKCSEGREGVAVLQWRKLVGGSVEQEGECRCSCQVNLNAFDNLYTNIQISVSLKGPVFNGQIQYSTCKKIWVVIFWLENYPT